MSQSELQKLTQALFELKITIEHMSERQDQMIDDVKKIKEAVYNPDSGIYARLRALEQWKASQSKIQWALVTTIIGLVTATVYKFIIGG